MVDKSGPYGGWRIILIFHYNFLTRWVDDECICRIDFIKFLTLLPFLKRNMANLFKKGDHLFLNQPLFSCRNFEIIGYKTQTNYFDGRKTV